MKLLLALFALIAASDFIVEAYKGRVRMIPRTLKKDPWLIPKEGVLVTEHTPVYIAAKDDNGEVQFSEVPGIMEKVAALLLNDEKYRRASIGNVSNPQDYPIHYSTLSSSVPGQWPHILYPKILLVVGNDLYIKLGENMMEAIPYLLAFWNGVDMMYRSIENPKIRLNIAGIIFERDSGVFDYLAPHSPTNPMITGYAMSEANRFWNSHQIPLASYDEVVTVTTQSLCLDLYECNSGALGKSWISSICSDYSSQYGRQRVIMFTDDGQFAGIPFVAHELGHALGMYHDDDQRFRSEEELKDLPSCRNGRHGHIMSALPSSTVYQQEWSQCSLEQLEKFIKTKNPTCLYDPPAVGRIQIPRLLPGKLTDTSLLDRCEQRGFRAVCDDPISWSCEALKCKSVKESYDCTTASKLIGPPGTICESHGPDAFCMFEKCVSESEFT